MKQYDFMSSAVDWITVTAEDNDKSFQLYELVVEMVEQEKLELTRQDRAFHGYQGIEWKGLFWGEHRTQGAMVRMSSYLASRFWRPVFQAAEQCSRLDLQTTVFCKEGCGVTAATMWEDLTQDEISRRGYQKIEGSDGGWTLYIGSRRSAQFGRIYDKGVQDGSAGRGRKIRYEIEFKKPISLIAAERLSKEEERLESNAILATVYDWFKNRGVEPVFHRGTGFPLELQYPSRLSSDDHQKLRWLKRQVRPAVGRLIDAGLGREALAALGLEELEGFDKIERTR